ncbi:16S rRNA (uracil(1498)-N(3))-methyltransferase [Rhodoferax sp. BAB1]|uniref:16S rRNA (uracil(1498)-N(3))-methyltransferase n=1 Tax=Rhodoferax sp. BAB1 TaxID=2741720 RepID=UPI0015775515|nr:16S rRNA (uracil(1498)-N(3))-methyltransferase [Rhodoferax sp. BAB1]QKO23437.1 16S rRNA (uracil(1498)-N(3))-methyltransferase [Rhodoferax sp. BAB1]
MPRFHCPTPLPVGATLELPDGAARHVQVLRLQPGDAITLFNGVGGECEARITRMGRSEVLVEVAAHTAIEREAPREVHLALGMPANERMDWLVEKATELGAASLQPLQAERSVLRLSGERAEKKRSHWQGVAIAACEQSGRNRVPTVHAVSSVAAWLASGLPVQRLLLSLQPDSIPLSLQMARLSSQPVVFLSGPEGGLSPAEEQAARAQGFVPVSLGARTLRAETAPLAALASLTLGP